MHLIHLLLFLTYAAAAALALVLPPYPQTQSQNLTLHPLPNPFEIQGTSFSVDFHAAAPIGIPPSDYTLAPGGFYIPPPIARNDTGAGGYERGGPGGEDPTAISGTLTALITSTPLGQAPASAPAPTQAGIVPNCNIYAKAISNDSCQSFAQINNITSFQLCTWNTILGASGKHCTTQFLGTYFYGVAIIGNANSITFSSHSTISATAPSPTESDIPLACNKYGQFQPGTSCSAFATANNISVDNLYRWNPVLGAGCSNCDTQLFKEYYYCTDNTVLTPF
ncbi:MAG: hypothetical protein LQ350_006990 [Teloschistes chrysophthalmus]|nr:MAG: hypothetical protein LQ350_006990 [Niorma chrysophthalma]